MTAATTSAKRSLLRSLRSLRQDRQANPLDHVDLLPHQDAYLKAAAGHRKRLLRLGNQLGKTFVGCLEDIYYALGRHPYDPLEPLQRQWVVGSTRQQSLSAQHATWSLIPKHLVSPGQRYDSAEGFGRNNPYLRLTNGAIIHYVSDRQGTLALAGATIDRVRFDEPVRPETYGEAAARVRQGANRISFTLTPVGRDCTYIQEMVERGELHETHARMTPETMTYIRSGLPKLTRDGQVCDAQWVESTIADCLPYEVPVRIHGEWDMATEGAFFAGFRPASRALGGHLTQTLPDVDFTIYIGMDHGTGIGNQAACVVGFAPDGTVWVLGEWVRDTLSTVQSDAKEILKVLDGLGLHWSQLQQAYGDIPAGQGVAKRGNIDMETAIAKELRLRSRKALRPRIRTTASKRGKGSNPRQAARYAYQWLHRKMAEGSFFVHESCEHLTTALARWDGTPASPWKHIIDALHYGCSGVIAQRRAGRATVLKVR